MDIVFATLFLGLFYNFYSKTYKGPNSRAKHTTTSNGVNGEHKNGVYKNGTNFSEVHSLGKLFHGKI